MRRWMFIGPACLALAAAVTLALWPHSRATHVASAAPLAAPPILTGPTPSTLPTPAVATKTPPHDQVAAAGPTHFLLSGPAFRVSANVCAMPAVFPLDPPGDQVHTVCWVEFGFGVAPGTAARGTTYVLGHAWSVQKLVLNPLSEYATAHEGAATRLASGVTTISVPSLVGRYAITLTSPAGTLTYTVDAAFLVNKDDARGVSTLMDTAVPDRVVLITCAVKDGVDLPQNVVLYAKLTSSRARH